MSANNTNEQQQKERIKDKQIFMNFFSSHIHFVSYSEETYVQKATNKVTVSKEKKKLFSKKATKLIIILNVHWRRSV